MSDVLDIVALRSLTGIADAGGFRCAAESLHLSQPAISAHVRRLEIARNQSLIDRTGKGLPFPAAGQLLVVSLTRLDGHGDHGVKPRRRSSFGSAALRAVLVLAGRARPAP
jgi:hypothetical protein